MDYRCSIEGSVPSDMSLLREFIADAMERVAYYVTDANLQYDIRLIIDELLLNGAVHGNAWDRNKKVHLRMEFIDHNVRIMVRDEGSGFHHLTDEHRCTTDRCGGRGLFIVESICKSVQYEGNTIHCCLELS